MSPFDTVSSPKAALVCVGQEGEHNELAQQFLDRAVSALAHRDLELVGSPTQVAITPAEVMDCVRAGRHAGADCVIYLIGTWILADKVVDAIRSVNLPAAIWGIPEGISFSSVGANVVHGALEELGIQHTLFYGQPDDPQVVEELLAYAKACQAVEMLRHARLGLLGGRSISAYPTAADPNQIKEIFGAEVIHIDQLVLLERAKAIPEDRLQEEREAFSARYGGVDAPENRLEQSLRVYLALKDIRQDYLWGIPEGISFSSVGANVVHGALEELGIQHTLFYGQPDDPQVVEELLAYAKACQAVEMLRHARLGLLGGRSISAYPTAADPNQIKEIFGAEVIHIDQLVLLERAKAIPEDRLQEEREAFSARYGGVDAPENRLEQSLRVYLALKDIRQDYQLDFLAVKCLEEFIETYTSCCTAISLLNSEGIVTACQSDLNAALSMFLLHALSGRPTIFGDVNTVDCASGVARMINCGSMPVALAGKEPVRWIEQYEYMGAGRGVCPVFCCQEGPVTFGTFSRIKGSYRLLIAKGEAYEEPFDSYQDVRAWPQGFIRLLCNPRQFYQNLRSNHSVVGYGDLTRQLRYAAELLQIQTVELKS